MGFPKNGHSTSSKGPDAPACRINVHFFTTSSGLKSKLMKSVKNIFWGQWKIDEGERSFSQGKCRWSDLSPSDFKILNITAFCRMFPAKDLCIKQQKILVFLQKCHPTSMPSSGSAFPCSLKQSWEHIQTGQYFYFNHHACFGCDVFPANENLPIADLNL